MQRETWWGWENSGDRIKISLFFLLSVHPWITWALLSQTKWKPLTEPLSKTDCVCVCVCVVTWCHCDFSSLWCIRGRLWRGTARGNVMSSRGAEGEPSIAGSCPFYWVDVWVPGAMAQRVSALPPTCKTQCTHTHTHTHTCLSILATAQGMPTHQLACVLARWGERGLGCSEQGQSMCAFMSFMFFYVISQHAFARRWCLCETCVLSDQGKISCYFQMALFKRLLWCIKSDLKCACSCLWFFFFFFFFSPKAPVARHAL